VETQLTRDEALSTEAAGGKLIAHFASTAALAIGFVLLLVSGGVARAASPSDPQAANHGLGPGAQVPSWVAKHHVYFTPPASSNTGLPRNPKAIGGPGSQSVQPAPGFGTPPLYWRGGNVQHSPKVYLIFWGSNWNVNPGLTAANQLRALYPALSGSDWQGILTQYYDSTSHVAPTSQMAGAFTDTRVSAPTNVDIFSISSEISYAISTQQWTPTADSQFVVVPAPGSTYTNSSQIDYCAYHGWSTFGITSTSYTLVPYPGDTPFYNLCSALDQNRDVVHVLTRLAAHEYAESATDPDLRDWYTSDGYEIADVCSRAGGWNGTVQGPGGFYVQNLWDNYQNACSVSDPTPPVWHQDNLGGSISSSPDVASAGQNLLEVFARGANGDLVHDWWNPCCGWSGWYSLGGQITGGPAAVSWGPGRMDVVARDASNNSVDHWWYDGTWHSDNLGGNITSDPDISSWGPGRLDIVARGTSGNVAHRAYDGGQYFPWDSLGGSIVGGPTAVSWSSGRIDVAARTSSNGIAHWYWQNPGGWVADTIPGTITSDPDLSSRGPGRLDLFAQGFGGGLTQIQWSNGYGWSPPTGSLAGSLVSSPGAVSWDPYGNRIDVVGGASDNTVTHWWWG
jgi:hypothetical protein